MVHVRLNTEKKTDKQKCLYGFFYCNTKYCPLHVDGFWESVKYWLDGYNPASLKLLDSGSSSHKSFLERQLEISKCIKSHKYDDIELRKKLTLIDKQLSTSNKVTAMKKDICRILCDACDVWLENKESDSNE